jgi:hypothetical protein
MRVRGQYPLELEKQRSGLREDLRIPAGVLQHPTARDQIKDCGGAVKRAGQRLRRLRASWATDF